jgi:hypothetical protein
MSATAPFYKIYHDLKKHGWTEGFETSVSGLPFVHVPGAPRFGGSSGDAMYFSHYTKPDGTTLYQRGPNMNSTVTTVVIYPDGDVTVIKTRTLIEAETEIYKLNIL